MQNSSLTINNLSPVATDIFKLRGTIVCIVFFHFKNHEGRSPASPKSRQLEVGAQRAPRLANIMKIIMIKRFPGKIVRCLQEDIKLTCVAVTPQRYPSSLRDGE